MWTPDVSGARVQKTPLICSLFRSLIKGGMTIRFWAPRPSQRVSLLYFKFSWFQTSLPLTALPFHHLSLLAVSELQLTAATPFWFGFPPRGIDPKLNRSQLSADCRCGRSSEIIDWLAWHCSLLVLGLFSAASGACACAVVQNHHQSGNAASGKLVWKQH